MAKAKVETVEVKLVRSLIGSKKDQIATARSNRRCREKGRGKRAHSRAARQRWRWG